ncbi:MAG: hypothetical protein AAF490_14570 [Chloroflexota bacterium]
MKKMNVIYTLLSLFVLLFAAAGLANAQEERGAIHGAIYIDVNGDGVCVNTGVEGEDPVAGVPIEFVSSDEAVVINLETGADGTYGLVAAGQSIWRVTAKPDASEWTVTSENPLYPPVLPETGLIQTDVNFCVANGSGSGVGGDAVIVLPESGAPASTAGLGTLIPALSVMGILFIAIGVVLEVRRRQTIS